MRPFLLVNTNISHPPVSPVGMEYVGHAVVEAGIPVEVLDLAFEPDWQPTLRRKLSSTEPLAIGIAVRNTDDCSFASRQSFLPWISRWPSEKFIPSSILRRLNPKHFRVLSFSILNSPSGGRSRLELAGWLFSRAPSHQGKRFQPPSAPLRIAPSSGAAPRSR